MYKKVKTEILLDTRYKSKNDTYPVKLRLTHKRVQKYYPVQIHLSIEDFEKVQGAKPRVEYKKLKVYFNAVEQKAIDIIDNMEVFDFDTFKMLFNNEESTTTKNTDVYKAFQVKIDNLLKSDRAGTAGSNRDAMNSLMKFRKHLQFKDITPDLLSEYENWMLNNNKTLTTIGMYLRSLRAIYNDAIEDGVVSKDDYPFGRRRYKIPFGRNIKKALSLGDIKKIYYYECKLPNQQMYKDYWLFIYLCNGMNPKDVLNLKYKNIKGEVLIFRREKTKRTTKSNVDIVIPLSNEIQEIIDKYGTTPKTPENYIFPYFTDKMTESDKIKVKSNLVKQINKYMTKIGEEIGIGKITTYTARHSFATVLKRAGASTEIISESLGHQNINTTKSYLDSFDIDTKKAINANLLSFED